MTPQTEQQKWALYRTQELAAVTPLLAELGFALEVDQPHLGGERYLMQALTTTSGRKLVLVGHRINDHKKVIIKATSDAKGLAELEHERECRRVLSRIRFAYRTFHSPEEILFAKRGAYTISIQEFIEAESTFLARPLEEQFDLALKAFKAQEGAHATTYGHERLIGSTFGNMEAADYLAAFDRFVQNIQARSQDPALAVSLKQAGKLLVENKDTIEQYGAFLTHTDFVPHNFRVSRGELYLLDHSSLRFGNKYEGWARFINFMTLYNPPLADALIKYVALNRTPEESLALKLMRVYRLGEIICYYTNSLSRTEGDLHTLNTERVRFWAAVLSYILTDQPVPASVVENYKTTRDTLRSDEEKLRQKDLH